MPSRFDLDLKKYGSENVAPVFSLFTAKRLGISKSYFNRLKNTINNGGELPKTIQKKIISKTKKSERISIKFYKETPLKITIPKTITETIRKTKKIDKPIKIKEGNKFKIIGTTRVKPQHIWVKFSLYKDIAFMKSAVLPINKVTKLGAFINDYIDIHIRQYKEKEAIYITSITIQLI